MKFSTATIISALTVCAANAQRIAIGSPADGAQLTPGSSFQVRLDRPNTLTGSNEIAIVIGLSTCATNACPPASDSMGSFILYNGTYLPEYHETDKPPYQNFTVSLPTAAAEGPAMLKVWHVSLVGASRSPFTETLNSTLRIIGQ
ncbi:hypothetical protein CPB83DRAFT_861506 [Crepidotus variabilis]|uniref:Uncharacterized protein n=1 Tax=Crepidotus variabilis TaxID=179855 RepID=A0A9P6JKH5_9AGAR|nr:hypothetical protein CPB83DRAFT_861506 [Crepidotus variabilis]